MKNILFKTVAISVLTSSILLGATPTIGDIEKQIIVPKEVQPKEVPLIEIGGVKKYAPPMVDDTNGKTIFVKSFKIENAVHITKSKLQKLISSYNSKDLTFNQLQKVAGIITQEYQKQGYFTSRAYLPVQDIKKNNGVIIISIIEGNYGKFNLKNESLVNDSMIQGILDKAKTNKIVSNDSLQRSILIINDMPGAAITSANVSAGSEVGTSDFDVISQSSKKYDGYILTDNNGSKYTGRYRLMAGVNWNSPFEIGDKLSLSTLVSNGTNLKNGRVAYSFPLNYSGLRGEISYSQTNYSLVKLDGTPDDAFTGNSKTFEGKLSYPFIRSKAQNLYGTFSFGKKDLDDEYNGTKRNPRNSKYAKLGLNFDKNYLAFNKSSQSSASFSLTYGDLSFDNAADEAIDLAGADTSGTYSKVNLDLFNSILLTNNLSLDTSLSLQYALGHKNLDGGEDLSIGGSSGVKLYSSDELSAENGYLFNLEAKYKLSQFNSVGLFYDVGRAFMADNTVGFESRTLYDAGVGYYFNYKNIFSKVQVAWDVNSSDVTAEYPHDQSRVLFQIGMRF